MFERISPVDASFLYLDRGTTPMQVGALSIFDCLDGQLTVEDVRRRISRRLAYVPRFRMRVREIPLALGRPVWVPDDRFDLDAHIRHCVLARPGTHAQLEELTARILARPLDRERPLWELHVVEGLADGTVAVISKTHQALVDGNGALDITQFLLDEDAAEPTGPAAETWYAPDPPTDWELVAATLTGPIVQPVDALRSAASTVTSTLTRMGASLHDTSRWAREALTAAVSVARAPVTASLQADVGMHRRFATASIALDEFQTVHRSVGGSVQDAILTAIAGALRAWLVGRGASVDATSVIRVLIPVATASPGGDASSVSAFLVDLPVGESDPLIRLQRVSHDSSAFTDVSRALGARTLVSVAGFGPATLHALGARLAAGMSSRVYNLAVVNVPGPQRPLYAGRARLIASYPVMPLVSGQALALGVTSYDGMVFLGANGDRDALLDLDDLVACVPEAVRELREAAQAPRSVHYARVETGP